MILLLFDWSLRVSINIWELLEVTYYNHVPEKFSAVKRIKHY